MLTISELYIYPVKSLAGIKINTSALTSRGLLYDRRWMLVDASNQFLTQREYPGMALLKTKILNDAIIINNALNPPDQVSLPLEPDLKESLSVKIWEDTCDAQFAEDNANEWFSRMLGIPCKAVYMPGNSYRKVDPEYSITEEDITSFSDAYPILLIGQASLDDLNSRLGKPLPMNRFRPNIVFTGGAPFEEDEMKQFIINDQTFYGVKLCGRCVVTTTNQETAERGKEPLKTLATYRTIEHKVCFGQNVICPHNGMITVGDRIETVL